MLVLEAGSANELFAAACGAVCAEGFSPSPTTNCSPIPPAPSPRFWLGLALTT